MFVETGYPGQIARNHQKCSTKPTHCVIPSP